MSPSSSWRSLYGLSTCWLRCGRRSSGASGPTNPWVGLSFDDGPSVQHTPRVLEILAKHNARATFFLIGARAAEDPVTLNRIRSAGHEVGNHCFTIRSTTRGSDQEFLTNLLRTEAALGLQGDLKLFRPPGGALSGLTTGAGRSPRISHDPRFRLSV